jgi:carboxyl-terminal processing protease
MAHTPAGSHHTYRQLSLFGDVFERVRTGYVEKPDDADRRSTACCRARSAFEPLDPKIFRDMQIDTSGGIRRLGIEVTMEDT